jgi:DNA mismatch repair protein MutH
MSNGSKNDFSSDGQTFSIILEDSNRVEQEFLFYGVEIKTIQVEKSATSGMQETIFVIKFMADSVRFTPI